MERPQLIMTGALPFTTFKSHWMGATCDVSINYKKEGTTVTEHTRF